MSINFIKRGNSRSKTDINLFIQNTQPAGYDGIWIQSSNYSENDIVVVNDENSLVPSKINIVQGSTHTTGILNNSLFGKINYQFSKILIIDSSGNIDHSISVKYGTGSQWKEINIITYTELEYIESTGTQYINTGIVPIHHQVQCEFEYTSLIDNKFIFGCNYYMYGYFRNQSYASNFSGTQDQYLGAINVNTKYNIIFNDSQHRVIVNGQTKRSDFEDKDNLTTPISVFSRGPYSNYISQSKIYSFKIIDNSTGELLLDLIPVRRNSDNVVCMYDKVSAEYFINAGSEDFIAGPEVNET